MGRVDPSLARRDPRDSGNSSVQVPDNQRLPPSRQRRDKTIAEAACPPSFPLYNYFQLSIAHLSPDSCVLAALVAASDAPATALMLHTLILPPAAEAK